MGEAERMFIEPPEDMRRLTQEELQETIALHDQWLASEGQQGKRANLRNCDLKNMDLSNVNLSEASFRCTDLAGVNLENANLSRADMAEVSLQRANLQGAVMQGASLQRASLRYANLQGADMSAANLNFAFLEGVSIMNVQLNGANMREASMRGAIIKNSSIMDANLRGADLAEAIIQESNLSRSDLRDADCERTLFEYVTLSETNFRGARLDNVDLKLSDFSGAIDVSVEYHAQSFHSEWQKIHKEREQLFKLRQEILSSEKAMVEEIQALEKDKSLINEMSAEDEKFLMTYDRLANWFRYIAFGWLAIVGVLSLAGVALISSINTDNLKFLEVALFFGVMTFLMVMVILTAWRARAVSVLLHKYSLYHREKTRAIKVARRPAPQIQKQEESASS